MAVVVSYGSGYKNPAALSAIEAIFAEAQPKIINSQASIANGDSIASTYLLGRVPSSAILDPESRLYSSANAGLTSVSLGLTQAGLTPAPNALINAQSIAAGFAPGAGTLALFSVPLANLNLRAWQLAGFAADPGGMLDVYLTINTASTAASTVTLNMRYSKSV